MSLSEHQWQITSPDGEVSLVFGTLDTGIQTRKAPDLGQRSVRNSDVPLPREDGRGFGPDYEAGTTITFEANVLTDHPGHQTDLLNDLRRVWSHKAFRADSGKYAILTTCSAGRIRRCYGRPRRFAETEGDLTHRGYTGVVFDFATIDGKFYDDTETLETLSLVPSSSGGLQGPLTDPLSIADSGERYGEITVTGEDTWPVVTIHGPVADPVVDFGDFTLGLNLTLTEGQYVTIDPRPWNRGVYRNDGANLAGSLTYDTPPMRDLRLRSGRYLVSYRGIDDTATSVCWITWRGAHGRP